MDSVLPNKLLRTIWVPVDSGPYCVPTLPANQTPAAAVAGITGAHLLTSDDVTSAWRSPCFVDMVRFAFTIGFPKRVDNDTAVVLPFCIAEFLFASNLERVNAF
jgi:hypothetical protein